MILSSCLSNDCVLKRSSVLNEYQQPVENIVVVCCSAHVLPVMEEKNLTFPLIIVVCPDVIWTGMMLLRNLSKDTKTIITLIAHENASAQLSLFIVGGGVLECQLIAQGTASCVTLQGGYSARGLEVLTLNTAQTHTVTNSSSSLTFFGVVWDRAQVSYKGLITIGPQAGGTRASQENKNMVIGRRAHVTSVPAIEVLNNEVQCTHGSAISYLDDEQVGYLHSRGIDQIHAQPLLLESFLASVFEDSDSSSYFNDIVSCVSRNHELHD